MIECELNPHGEYEAYIPMLGRGVFRGIGDTPENAKTNLAETVSIVRSHASSSEFAQKWWNEYVKLIWHTDEDWVPVSALTASRLHFISDQIDKFVRPEDVLAAPTSDGAILLEMWKAEKKLSLYIEEDNIEAIQVLGTTMQSEIVTDWNVLPHLEWSTT